MMRFSIFLGLAIVPHALANWYYITDACDSYFLVGTQFGASCDKYDDAGNRVMITGPQGQQIQDLVRPVINLNNCVYWDGNHLVVCYRLPAKNRENSVTKLNLQAGVDGEGGTHGFVPGCSSCAVKPNESVLKCKSCGPGEVQAQITIGMPLQPIDDFDSTNSSPPVDTAVLYDGNDFVCRYGP